MLLVTHELGPVADLATRVLVLGRGGHGSVRYDGPPPPPRDLSRTTSWHHDATSPAARRRAAGLMEALRSCDPAVYDFMQRALVAAALVGLVAPLIGVFLVQRRLALLGDGMGHVALTGVGPRRSCSDRAGAHGAGRWPRSARSWSS